MGRHRQVSQDDIKKIKYWLRWTKRIGNRQQLAYRLGISDVTLGRYIRAIQYGVVDAPFNASGYVLNKSRTGYVGGTPRKKREYAATHHVHLPPLHNETYAK